MPQKIAKQLCQLTCLYVSGVLLVTCSFLFARFFRNLDFVCGMMQQLAKLRTRPENWICKHAIDASKFQTTNNNQILTQSNCASTYTLLLLMFIEICFSYLGSLVWTSCPKLNCFVLPNPVIITFTFSLELVRPVSHAPEQTNKQTNKYFFKRKERVSNDQYSKKLYFQLSLNMPNLPWPEDSKVIFSIIESSCHLPTCLPHTMEASHIFFNAVR